MTDIFGKLALILERLPVAVVLVSASGQILGKAGGMASLLGTMAPSHDVREAKRWAFSDRSGAAIPANLWPTARALRGERLHDGMIGKFLGGDERTVKVISMPVVNTSSDVAAVTFMQVLDARTRSADGSHQDLQQRMIDELAAAVAASYQDVEPTKRLKRA
jgi:hypothetical protein